MENTQQQQQQQQSQVLNAERVQELETWLKTTNTKLTQVNGQRKYGGPPDVWEGPFPGARCEVFISQIPRDAYEDLLIPLFSSVGPLWEFRLMMNFSGQNRGFAYAKYGSPAIATNAIRLLHGHILEPGSRLSVRRSTEKRHLCMGDLPAATRQEDLLQVLRVLTEGVERVSLKAGPGIEGVSAIVAFSSHHTASMAKKVLVEGWSNLSRPFSLRWRLSSSSDDSSDETDAFKKQFSLSITIKWQSAVKPSSDERLPFQKPSKGLLPSPVKPPHHILHSPQSSVLPPRLARPPSIPPGFCKAVGGPTTPQRPPPPSSSTSSSCSYGHRASSSSPVVLLRRMCEASGVGQPLYEMHYSHTGSDGFIYFTFKVCIPGIPTTFEGVLMILPGPSTTTMLEEVQWAAAQQVLHRVYSHQLTQ